MRRESKEQKELRHYYGKRAPVYEDGYSRDDEVFQAEITQIKEEVQSLFRGRKVLEIACGTGVWTRVLASVAKHVTATDISSEVLAEARKKNFDPARVSLIKADAYDLSTVPGQFNAGMAGFWFSHVPKSRISEFLTGFHMKLGKGSLVFLCDNTFEEGRGGKLVRGKEDTFTIRELPDKSQHKVLKNYYDEPALRTLFSPLSRNLTIHAGKWFWWVSYNVA